MGPERRRPAQGLAGRPALARQIRVAVALAAAVLVSATAAGCGGGGGDAAVGTTPGLSPAGGTGTLRYDIVAIPDELDPLHAVGREQQLVSSQLHEPLVATLSPPYSGGRPSPGLALSMKPSRDHTIWTAELRGGVSFHDGTPFNAAAVLANGRRWASLPQGRALVPGLYAIDAPRPDVVRFLLRRPLDLPGRLASPRLGIVAPQSLRPRNGIGARVSGIGATGTGPFVLSGIDSDTIALTRYTPWWGSPLGLGPALDGVEFRGKPDEHERLDDLEAGRVDVADALPSSGLAEVAADPLLSIVPGPQRIGISRAVRGFDSPDPMSFSGVWLTTVGGG